MKLKIAIDPNPHLVVAYYKGRWIDVPLYFIPE